MLGAVPATSKSRQLSVPKVVQTKIPKSATNDYTVAMPKLNIFIDGSWLFKACAPEKALAARTECVERTFPLDFAKLNSELLAHARSASAGCTELGECHISTSIFALPDDFDEWPNDFHDITAEDIARTRSGTFARQRFVDGAIASGYSDRAVYHPKIKGWILDKLRTNRYQEKQVDATVVALLVRSAITQPEDVHVVITGDADILPAIKVAYPEYSTNVFIATTHPDELAAERRQTSFSLSNFDFRIDPYYLQDHAEVLMQGQHIYRCAHCNKVFSRAKAIPAKARPCCNPCNAMRK